MTRDRLLADIARFRARVAETERNLTTPKAKGAHTRAVHCLRRAEKMLVALDTRGSVSFWHMIDLPHQGGSHVGVSE